MTMVNSGLKGLTLTALTMPYNAFPRPCLHLHDILNRNELKNKTHLTAKMYEKLLSRHTGLSGPYTMTARLDATAFLKKKENQFLCEP